MWSDKETNMDCLGFTSYVEVLADICLHKDLAPLTLGVFGLWGSGKTSLMRMLMAQFEQSGLERTEVLWFNAWMYEGKEEAQSALIHAILNRLKSKRTITKQALDAIDQLKQGASILKLSKFIAKTAVTLTPDIAGFIDCFKDESEKVAKTMESFEADFERLLEMVEVDRVIVFIDDLDRCSSTKVIETFETIKLFLNTPSCTFVIGADPARIEHAVGEVYSVSDPSRRKDYLEKIVQIPFNIPQQSVSDIACYVGMLVLGQYLNESGSQELAKSRSVFAMAESPMEGFVDWHSGNRGLFDGNEDDLLGELQGVLPYIAILASGLRGNPRQIKRFLNILALRRRLAKANALDVQPDLLVKMGVLEYVWNDFFSSLADTIDPATGFSSLVGEMLKPDSGEADTPTDSKLLSESLETSGLLQFLHDAPQLTDRVDLRPYLFLAQTSLNRGQIGDIVSIDEQVNAIIRSIESEDRIVSDAGARKAASAEPAAAEAVVRILLNHLPSMPRAVQKTRAIIALQTICRAHKTHFPAVLKALPQLDTRDTAVSLSAMTLIEEAKGVGVAIPDGLENRFGTGSRLAGAIAGKKKTPSKP